VGHGERRGAREGHGLRALARALEAAGRHPRHVVLAAFVAGLLAAPVSAVAAGAAVAAGGLLAARTPRRPGLALLAAAAVLAGASLAQARLASLDRSALGPLLGREVTVRATLAERPRLARSGPSRQALARLASGPGRGERVVLWARRWPRAQVGEEVVAVGPLAPLRRRDGWQRRRGAHARLFARRLRRAGQSRGGVAGLLDRLRRGAEHAVTSGLDPPRAALARGMVLGQDEALDERTRQAFRDSGLAHLLAASGQNVMLLVALALPLLAVLGLGLRVRLAACLALIALYVPLAGAGPSIQRAGVMGAAGLVAVLASRPASRWYALLLAAAVTLAVDPRAAGDPGWQLSFAAVVAIFALGRPLAGRLRARRVPAGLAEAAAITTAATLGTAPLLAFHFERVSLVSLPANVLAVPAVAPVMWLGMVAIGVAALLPPGAVLVNALAQYPLAYVDWLARGAAAAPHASVPVALGGPAGVVAVYAAIVLLALAAGRPRRRGSGWRGAAGALLLAAAALTLVALGPGRAPAPPDPRDLVVSFLDVGQGDATLVQHGGATVLVDTGPPGSPLLGRLRDAGVRRIDLLVVTHAQADHEGGAADVLRRLPVGTLLDGGDGANTALRRAALSAAAGRRVRRVLPDAGQVLRAGPIELRVLWPSREPPKDHAGEDPNRRAIVAHLRAGSFDLLLPADAESEVTSGLELEPVEALKVAHHGSADPDLPDLLARLRPRVAVIEAGRGNRYGHPAPPTLAALRAVPVVRRTDRHGTVRLVVRGGRMTVAHGR
jgi:competence protein ComEC